MTVYLGSPNSQVQAHAANGMPVLLSYFILHNRNWWKQYVPSFKQILIDCGAYSAYTSGKEIDPIAYRDWAAQYPWADACAGVDDIAGDFKKSLKNYEIFGFPTMHDSDPIDLIDDLIPIARERGNWIGIGLVPPREGKENFVRHICDRVPPDMHIHGWALRQYLHIPRINSADSTAWFRNALTLKNHALTAHLTYAECVDIMVKRFQRAQRIIAHDDSQLDLF